MTTPNFIFGSDDPAVTNARIRAQSAMNTAKQLGYSGDVPRLGSNVASSGKVIDITPRSMSYRVGRAVGNGLSRLSTLAADGILGTVAAPALAGAGWAFMNGARMDNDGTTKQLANEMNQAFKAGLYVDDEGNYVDANTNEIVGPETAAKRIDAVAASTTSVPATDEAIGAQIAAEEAALDPRAQEAKDLAYLRDMGVVADTNAKLVPNALDSLNGLSDAELAKAVIGGKYGNGEARKKALGDRYAAVQALVNANQSWRKPAQRKGTEIEGVAFTPRDIPVTPAIREAELANGTQLVLQ